MKTIFLCSIGPVQDFIATARKSRDLWYGSLLLSELAKSIAKIIYEKYGSDSLIIPAPVKTKDDLKPLSDFSVPNKILAVFDELDHDFEETLPGVIEGRLKVLWEGAQSEIKGYLEPNDLAWKQIKDLVEFYWVAVPYEDDDGFKKAREPAEALLAARKNTRNFDPLESTGKPKSSLDGFRESVIPEEAYPKYKDNEKTKGKKIRDLYNHYHAKEGEQLSGVDLLKRLGKGKKEADFPSTSELAAAPFFEWMKKNKIKETDIIDGLKQILKDNEWQENQISEGRALVFESRLMEYLPLKAVREKAREEYAKILDEHVGKKRPSPYYALLIADGDNMGKVIDSKNDEIAHRELSKLISEFAIAVPKIIKEFQGTCIYAGGEDILAYLPLHTALACAAKLEADFKEIMKNQIFTENGKQFQPTLSGGLVIAHHLTPLSEVFKLARNAEKKSKTVTGKNALTIILNKRSGAERMVRDNWPALIKRFQVMIEMTRKGWISKGTAYELQGLAHEFPEATQPWLKQGIIDEASYIIERKRQPGTDKALLTEVKTKLVGWLKVLSISELALEMIIAAEFAGAEEMADAAIKEVLKCKNG